MNEIEWENLYTSGVYQKRNVCFVRGQGMTLWDRDGRAYLDFAAGISVANLGHSHPVVAAAIARQAATLITASEFAFNDQRARLLHRLAEITPNGLQRFFLCNSGTEAIEACIKFAHLATGRSHFIAAMRGFHGRTLGALAATHNEKYRLPFAALCPRFQHVPFNKPEKLRAAVDEQAAAVILELVQGEGGVRPIEPNFVAAARELCDRYQTLLIVDEIQTGFGRTGAMFACDHYRLSPDLLAMGKAIAGGVPMGAVGIGARVTGLTPGIHGSTFGGNPLACAAALAHLDVLQREGLVERAKDLGEYFYKQLSDISSPIVREVRGLGLMMAMELKIKVAPILQMLLDRGFVVLQAGPTVLRFLPPLIVERSHMDALIDALREVLATEIPAVDES